jgi:hypothetical protein
MGKWVSTLVKLWNNRMFFTNMRKRNNKGMLWASLISLAVSGVALLVKRDQKRRVTTNMTSPFQSREPSYKPSMAAIVEASRDLTPDIKAYKEGRTSENK